MTAFGHVAVMAVAANWHPAAAIAYGVVSHGILDKVAPEYFPRTLHLTNPSTWKKHWRWLLWQGMGIVMVWLLTGNWWLMLYAMLPDLLEGVHIGYGLVVHGENYWMKGKALLPFHRAQASRGDDWSHKTTTIAEITLLLLAVVITSI